MTARCREKLREGQPRQTEQRSQKGHRDSLEPPAPDDLVDYICGGDERFYTLEQKHVAILGRLGHLLHLNTVTSQTITVL